MGVGASSDSSGVTHITDVTKVEKEHVVFDWVILDFDPTNLNFEARSSSFSGGESLGRPSQWYLELKYSPDLVGHFDVGLFLESAAKAVDGPKDITARMDLSLLGFENKTSMEFGHVTKTFIVPYFGGPQKYVDCYEWRNAIDAEWLKNNSNILNVTTDPIASLTIQFRLKMEIQGKLISSVAMRGPVWMTKLSKVHDDYTTTRPLWTSKENTDCIIKSQSVSINAHMSVLSSRSRIFATMLKLKHSKCLDTNENGNRVILALDELEPSVLETMLRYMYVGNLEGGPWDMDICSGLIQAADQFELLALRNSCFIKLVLGMSTSNAGDIAVFAHNHCASNEIKGHIRDFIRMNWDRMTNLTEFNNLVLKRPLAFAFFDLPVRAHSSISTQDCDD